MATAAAALTDAKSVRGWRHGAGAPDGNVHEPTLEDRVEERRQLQRQTLDGARDLMTGQPSSASWSKLHEADRLIAEGKSMAVVLKTLGISEQTYYRWRKAYGELSPDEARRLREVELENRRLKKLVADKELELDVMREIARGNF
jgi:transposase-like protein